MSKNVKTRIQNKYDIEANWLNAVNFIPLAGEIIVYLPDATHKAPRFKVGNGETLLGNLPFSDLEFKAHTADTSVHITPAERIDWNLAKAHADSAHAPSDAEKNQNAFSNVAINGQTTIIADSVSDTLNLAAGNNVTITTDAANDNIIITAADTIYTHPDTAGSKHIPEGGEAGQILRWSADGTAVWGTDNNTTYSDATQSEAGLMSIDDKKKLDGIEPGATKIIIDSALNSSSTNPVQNKVVDTAISQLNTLVGNTKVSAQISDAINAIIYPVTSVNNKTGQVTLDASDVDAVPTSRTINGKPLSSNITLSAYDIGAAASSHGNHVTYSVTAPVMDGTAATGTATALARSDHRHPTDTSRASKAEFDTHSSDEIRHITSTERTDWDTAKAHADSKHAPSDAEKNQNAFSNIAIGNTTIAADTATDTITLVAGSNVTITPNTDSGKITIAATDTTYSAGAGISLSDDNKFINSGVRSITTGSTNGTISVDTDGTSKEVAIAGLGSAAYTESTAYDTAGAAENAQKVATTYTDSAVSAHSVNTGAHNDIRILISELATRLNALADSDDKTLDQMSEVVAFIKNNKTLIDGITTSKVNVADIIDNLTTNAANKPLSAAQGVELKALIESNKLIVGSHEHNYAGSSTPGGAADSANKLNTNAGSETNPVYFSNGIPVKTKYTLSSSVPSDAKFTDTIYTHPKYDPKSSGLYRITVDDTGHVSETTAVVKSDITALGIPGSQTNVSFTRNLTSGTKVGTITINDTSTELYAPTNTDTHYISKNVVGSSTATNNTTTALSNGSVYLNSVENDAVTSTHKISGSGATTVTSDASGNIIISSTDSNTDTKVTSVDNHYAPAADTSAALTVDASSTTAATWNSTSLVTGVNLQRDAKGHVTGVTVDSIKMPANPDTHYTTGLKVGASATATTNAAASNGNVYLNVLDNTTVRDSHKIVGGGATTVTSDANGVITISSTDSNTTYSTGTTTTSGLTKLYTGTGSNTDGTMTQSALTTALAGKEASGAAASALTSAKSYADSKLNNIISCGTADPSASVTSQVYFKYVIE